ncbi:MFS general substrate transporter [Mycena polygramma]|nr:MFS general substrate transporter [Mycena polygramma]
MGSSIDSVEKEHEVTTVGDAKELAIETVNATEKYTQADFDRVLRKQDRRLMPLLWLAYGIQQVDKTGLSTQATFGIIADTHMKGNDYAWLSTIFFICFFLGEIPGNWVMQRTSVGKTLAITMFCWGSQFFILFLRRASKDNPLPAIVFCTAAARSWRDLMIMRAFQGLAESIANPAFLLITGLSYRTEEHALRVLIWGTSGNGFGIIIALINYGIGRTAQADPGGLVAWKGMSLFLGALSIFVSVICYIFLGTPREVFWLSAEEKKIQAARVAHNNTGSDAQKRPEWKWSQVKETFMDPQVYFLFFVTVANAMATGGINTFGNLIFVGLGFDALDTLIKGTLPQNVLGIFWFILAGYILFKYKHMRFYWMMLSIVPAFVGMLVLSLVPTTEKNLWPKWGAYLITVTCQICGALFWSMLSTNVAGRTKKSVVSMVLFTAYCFGNAVGGQIFQAKWAPRYRPSTVILSIMFALEFILMVLWRIYYITTNRRRAAQLDAKGISDAERIRLGSIKGETDVTDLQNEYFVYDY